MEEIELIKGALFFCKEGSGFPLLFYDETRQKGDKIKRKDMGDDSGEHITCV